MRLSLRIKLLGAVVLIIVFFGAVASYLIYKTTLASLSDVRKEGLSSTTSEHTHEVEAILNGMRGVVRIVAGQEEVKTLLNNPSKENYQKTDAVLNRFIIDKRFSVIYIADKEGKVLISTDRTLEGLNYAFRDYFKNAIGGREYLEMSVGVTTKKAGFYFSIPVITNGVIGVVVGKVEPESIYQTMKFNSIEDKFHLILVDEYGVVIYSDDEKKVLKSLGQLSQEEIDSLEKKNKYGGIKIEPLTYQELFNNVKNYKGPMMVELYDQADDEREIVTLAKIGNYPFYVLIEQESEVIEKAAERIGIELVLIVLVAAGVATLGILFIAGGITRNIARLTQMARSLAQKKFGDISVVKSGDELQELSEALVKTANELNDYVENVEKKVNEKTENLNKLNRFMVGRELKMIELKKKLNSKGGQSEN